ncbi:IQ and AAA domain-containing protein 1 isoform X1 [Poecilia latipinna]|uniref:IQ and AAA domain-containing protein 1 isoform X1 n=1 Tax=Poecilia latipinna TaxID=48699 RepID=UPI00072E581F|nr:PREDICTED: IQ and AAA domain-containing protein 1 isoform X1 [Poecilia latipinna]
MSKSCDLLSAAENAPPGASIRQVNSRTEIFMVMQLGRITPGSYNQVWKDAMSELSSLLAEELPPVPIPPQRDRVVFFQRLATLYVRYVQVFRQLEEAHNMLVHPQKRRLILLLLKGVMGRVLELKYEMVEKEFSEYHYVDDILHALKLTPPALEIPIPYFFVGERSKETEERKTMVLDVLNLADGSKDLDTSMDKVMTEAEAIKIIQMVERAWQGRIRAKLNKDVRFSNFDRRHRAKSAGSAFNELAAIRIQKIWKGYLQRKKTRIARDEEMIFLGMVMDPKYQTPLQAEIDAQAIDTSIRVRQKKHEEVYLNAIDAILKQIRELEWNDMAKTMKNQIRQWFYECRNTTGLFPDYPTVEEGGSAIIFAEKTPQQLVEEIALQEEEAASKSKAKGKDDKKAKDKKDKGKGKGAEDDDEGLTMMPSAFLSELEVANKRYEEVWKTRNESENFTQIHEVELIKEEMRKIVEEEVRLQVDEEMREELAELKLAVDKEKPGKQKGPKKKKGSKGGKKKKKEKDLTPDRTLESLCEELVQQGLLKRAKNFRMQDFLGDYNYLGTTLRQNDIEPMPSLLDVRQVLSLYGILPLGAPEVHEKAPLIKSILLVGPAGVGKSMLVHAICQETGATMFDLSPYSTAGKYPGKPGLAMMLHMVFKVARLLQPSVIWIQDAEKMFYKKVPKDEEQLEPRRLKKDLPKCLKLIKPEDRVLIIGTTKGPQNSDLKSMCKMYGKIILIPRPDYGSRYILWEKLIKKQGGKITNALDLTSLTKVTDGYTPGQMVQVISSVVTKDRINDLTKHPLTADDFIVPLGKFEPVLQKEEEALKSWYAKTPLGKRRIKAAAEKEDALLKAKDAKTKKKK